MLIKMLNRSKPLQNILRNFYAVEVVRQSEDVMALLLHDHLQFLLEDLVGYVRILLQQKLVNLLKIGRLENG